MTEHFIKFKPKKYPGPLLWGHLNVHDLSTKLWFKVTLHILSVPGHFCQGDSECHSPQCSTSSCLLEDQHTRRGVPCPLTPARDTTWEPLYVIPTKSALQRAIRGIRYFHVSTFQQNMTCGLGNFDVQDYCGILQCSYALHASTRRLCLLTGQTDILCTK